MSDGRTLDISKLILLLEGRKPVRIAFSSLRGISRSRRTGFSRKRLERVDTTVPGVVDEHHLLLDGRHRVVKLQAAGATSSLFWVASADDIVQATIEGEG